MTSCGLKRGGIYVLIAVVTQAVTDLDSAFSHEVIASTKFWLEISLAGLITWKAYIDKSTDRN